MKNNSTLKKKSFLVQNIYKIDENNCFFLSQWESYLFRGNNFEHYSPLEFECIIEIKKDIYVSDNAGEADLERKPGRRKISSFDLDSKNKLTKHSYKGFIRLKFLTPMFGGGPIPSFPNVNK